MQQSMAHHQFPLAAVPDGVLSGSALVALPPRKLGLVAMACLKLRRCADEAILQRARGSANLELRQDGEGIGDLLFAVHVLLPPTTTTGPCVAVGSEGCHTAVITSTGELLTFGCGTFAQLGHGGQGTELVPRRVEGTLVGKRVVQVVCGGNHTAVITSTGELFTFGDGMDGQLGHGELGSVFLINAPQRVEALRGERVVQVACGVVHTAVLTSGGDIFTFGSGRDGMLGHGGTNNELVPRRVRALVGRWVVQVACGTNHTAVVTSTGELFTFGYGRKGNLGHNSENEKVWVPRRVDALVGKHVVQVSCGVLYTAVITSDGELFTFGCGGEGQLGHGGKEDEEVPRRVDALVGKRVMQVSCGRFHTAAVTSDGELFTFGSGRDGKLGHGGTNSSLVPRWVEGTLRGKHVVQVECGFMHTTVLTTDGEIFTFGSGEFGQLGHGGEEGELVPRRVEALV